MFRCCSTDQLAFAAILQRPFLIDELDVNSGNAVGARTSRSNGCVYCDAVLLTRQAIETARRQQSKGWELRATTSLVRLWHRTGRTGDARGLLAAAYNTYTEGFTTPDLVGAKALLESLT